MEQTLRIRFFQNLFSTLNPLCSCFGRQKNKTTENKSSAIPEKHLYQRDYRFYSGTGQNRRDDQKSGYGTLQNPQNNFIQMDKQVLEMRIGYYFIK